MAIGQPAKVVGDVFSRGTRVQQRNKGGVYAPSVQPGEVNKGYFQPREVYKGGRVFTPG